MTSKSTIFEPAGALLARFKEIDTANATLKGFLDSIIADGHTYDAERLRAEASNRVRDVVNVTKYTIDTSQFVE